MDAGRHLSGLGTRHPVRGTAGGRRRELDVAAPPFPGPLAARIDFMRVEVADICGALALGGSLLRRLGLGAEAARLEALFVAVQERLAEPPPAAAPRAEPQPAELVSGSASASGS
jgi:hypothetical protein